MESKNKNFIKLKPNKQDSNLFKKAKSLKKLIGKKDGRVAY
jgi:hypothetical protein